MKLERKSTDCSPQGARIRSICKIKEPAREGGQEVSISKRYHNTRGLQVVWNRWRIITGTSKDKQNVSGLGEVTLTCGHKHDEGLPGNGRVREWPAGGPPAWNGFPYHVKERENVDLRLAKKKRTRPRPASSL